MTNGTTQVLDGPFADTKEQLSGVYTIDVPDPEIAVSWRRVAPPRVTVSLRYARSGDHLPDVLTLPAQAASDCGAGLAAYYEDPRLRTQPVCQATAAEVAGHSGQQSERTGGVQQAKASTQFSRETFQPAERNQVRLLL